MSLLLKLKGVCKSLYGDLGTEMTQQRIDLGED